MKDKDRAEFMTDAQKRAMGKHPRTHQNCQKLAGVSRPGKTAKDHWLKTGKKEEKRS